MPRILVILFRSRLTQAAGDDYARAAWRDAETLAAWACDPRHRAIQALGRDRWYEWYDMEVAQVTRPTRFVQASPTAVDSRT